MLSKIRIDIKEAVSDNHIQMGGLRIEGFPDPPDYQEIFREDLYFCFSRIGGKILAAVEYNAVKFKRSWIELLRDRYLVLLENLLKNENCPIRDVNFITQQERDLNKDMDVLFNV